MASQVRLTLQPPPNVDFVQGYPGIPPAAPDRPQASVVGAVEVRVPQQGIKAEWIRVELRKVEILPGGGPLNTFHDYVGPSPVTLWDAEKDAPSGGVLTSRDFSFQIRIPESMPPSIALEERAGIRYELVASVCTKGKKGFFRKRKPVVINSQAPIIIDKHDLHSTWPVYCQPEVRTTTQEGVTLTVERNHTCYGPGDRITLAANLKSDSLHTLILRGFELSLKETIVYRAGPHTTKRAAPSPKVTVICESKLPINATIYNGAHHSAELACNLSPSHTTTTLNAARHIDITYVLIVKALLGTGATVVMELPVIISNWPRNVSLEAVRRIGPAQQLSLLTPNVTPPLNPTQSVISSRTPAQPSPATLPIGRHIQSPTSGFSTLPAANPSGFASNTPTSANLSRPDEFGQIGSVGVGVSTGARTQTNANSQGRTRRSSGGLGVTNKFTIVNGVPSEIAEESSMALGPGLVAAVNTNAGASSAGGSQPRWLTAEEEKQRLYEDAKAKAELTQRNANASSTSTSAASVTQPAPVAPRPNIVGGGSSTARTLTQWSTAEEEKTRLYNEALAVAQRTQESAAATGYLTSPNASFVSSPATSRYASPSTSPATGPTSAGAALYQQAMSARNANQQQKVAHQPQQYRQATPPASAVALPVQNAPPVPTYLTAEQEKAQMRRYEEAMQAVSRTQTSAFGNPAAGMGPTGAGAGGSSSSKAYSYSSSQQRQPQYQPHQQQAPPHAPEHPPPFDGNTLSQVISEKERLRRAYEAQDAAALAAQRQQQQPSTPSSPPPPPFTLSLGGASGSLNGASSSSPMTPPPPFVAGPSSILSAVNEKELLRRKYEAQATAAAPPPPVSPPPGPAPAYATPPPSPPAEYGNATNSAMQSMMGTPGLSGPPQPPPRGSRTRPTLPAPAMAGAPSVRARVLSAAEEKAMLKARYEAQESGGSRMTPSYSAPPPAHYQMPSGGSTPGYPQPQPYQSSVQPPPLSPRPPVDYIKETQDHDVRTAGYASNGSLTNGTGSGIGGLRAPGLTLNIQPFMPFSHEFDVGKDVGPPPPLPPKPAGE